MTEQEKEALQWVVAQERHAAVSRLYEALRYGEDGTIVNVRTIPMKDVSGNMTPLVDFSIKVVRKYGIRWYATKPETQKRWQNGKAMLIDNDTLMDWCLHIEER